VKAVVLVGGEGTRLRPLTRSTPKQMLPIVGVPMIERVLGHLAPHGVDEAILSLGYLPGAFTEAYPEARAAGVRLTYAVEPEPLDTAGATRFAALAGGVSETFLVLNGDVLSDLDVTAIVEFHRRHGAEGTIYLHPVADPSAFGVVPTDADGRVTAFIEKPPPNTAPTNLINAGAYVLEPSVLDWIPDGRRVSIERETFPLLVGTGRLFAMAQDCYWLDTGTPADYIQAQLDLIEGRRHEEVGAGARWLGDGRWVTGAPELAGELVGSFWVGDGASIGPGARVCRSIIGPACHVAPGARVEGSVLLEGARVLSGASVEGSILGPGSVAGAGARIEAVSVIGAGALVGPGRAVAGERVPA
jgi:mannose-1-phosphate guanylyltransferase